MNDWYQRMVAALQLNGKGEPTQNCPMLSLRKDLKGKTTLARLKTFTTHRAAQKFPPSLPSAQTTLHSHYPCIDNSCIDNGLLELRIETTSEVVSILIG